MYNRFVKKKLKITLVVLVAIFVVPYLITTLNNLYENYSAEGKVQKAKARVEHDSDSFFFNELEKLKDAGLLEKEVASSKIDTCYIDTNEAGWMVSDWYQQCYIHYVAGFETKNTKEEAISTIDALASTKSFFGEYKSGFKYEDLIFSEKFVRDLENDYTTSIFFLNENSKVPNPKELDGGPIFSEKRIGQTVYNTYKPSEIVINGNQIWIVYKRFYYYEGLGCKSNILGIFKLSCLNPRESVIQ